MTQYKITYFPVKAVGEPIRFLLAYGGANWEDNRFKVEDWQPKLKKTTPYGQVPTLEFDGKVYYQSVAICRYLAKKYNLVGDNDEEALVIDGLVDTMVDCRLICGEFFRSAFFGLDEKILAKQKEPLLKETFPYYFSKFEETVKANGGYFVNGKLTWVDLYWAAVSDSWTGYVKTEDILKNYPNLVALQQKVFALPPIKAWIDRRPKTDM